MFGKKKKHKTECALCNETIKNNSLMRVDYLKIDGNIGIQMMHDNCYKKIKKLEREGVNKDVK